MAVDWNRDYRRYRRAVAGRPLPLALVDLDRFDANVRYVAATQARSGKTIRVASKSIRCPDLLRRVFQRGGPVYRGVLAFCVAEADFLARGGVDDLIVAYPTVQPSDLALLVEMTRRGVQVSQMVDCRAHLAALAAAGRSAGLTLNACLEIDMSWRPLGRRIHLGVRRSPVRSPQAACALADAAASLSGVAIDAVMGYEAQIASVNDRLPGRPLYNRLMRLIKHLSVKEFTRRRGRIVEALGRAGHRLRVVNGGGSGSLVSTGADPSVTEVSAGSAFFAPGLFGHFHEVRFQPAAFFALQVVRVPAPTMVTCAGGGYVASGEAGPQKLPRPVMPPGMRYVGLEGAGEVQTPLVLGRGTPVPALGDPVFFQHAKAGELCERFNTLALVSEDRIVAQAATYRGCGLAFP
jgi:D-serine deaminase-like pyridoxal phosphate-dependent protein